MVNDGLNEVRVAHCHRCGARQTFLMDGSQELPQSPTTLTLLTGRAAGRCSSKDIIAICTVHGDLAAFHPDDPSTGPNLRP
jgi:hypothetical protein